MFEALQKHRHWILGTLLLAYALGTFQSVLWESFHWLSHIANGDGHHEFHLLSQHDDSHQHAFMLEAEKFCVNAPIAPQNWSQGTSSPDTTDYSEPLNGLKLSTSLLRTWVEYPIFYSTSDWQPDCSIPPEQWLV